MKNGRFFIILVCLLSSYPSAVLAERCSICGEEMPGTTVYLANDKLTKEKVRMCIDCVRWSDVCTMCGLPVRKNSVKLSDGRFLCERDAKSAVLDPAETRRICAEVKDSLDRLLSRFISFPVNLRVAIVDRINLVNLFRMPGNDYECPNVL